MQPHMPAPLHCPQVQIKNLQVILLESHAHQLWLENQAPNFWHNPCAQCKTQEDQINMLDNITGSHNVEYGEKRFHRGSHNQSDLAADQFSQGRRVKVGPK